MSLSPGMSAPSVIVAAMNGAVVGAVGPIGGISVSGPPTSL